MTGRDDIRIMMGEVAGTSVMIESSGIPADFSVDGMTPRAIVTPRTLNEAAAVISCAHREKWAVIPRGGGTKMARGNVPDRDIDIVISTQALSEIDDCDTGNLTLTAKSGVTLNDVQRHLAREGHGYCVPLDPPYTEGATLGGIVATNASGPHRYLYGTARDIVLGMTVITPDGTTVHYGGKTVKNVTGYDMTKLQIGALGTLGFIGAVTVRLLPLPEAAATLLVPFASLDDAASYIHDIVHSSYTPAFIELFDREYAARLSRVPAEEPYCVAIGFCGVEEAVARQMNDLAQWGEREGARSTMHIMDDAHEIFIRELRDYPVTWTGEFPATVMLTSSVPLSRCTAHLAAARSAAEKEHVAAAFSCHAGNGIIRTYCEAADAVPALIQTMRHNAVSCGGALIVESAPTAVKASIDVWGTPRTDGIVMERLKMRFDPNSIFSPGRFIGGI